MRGRKENFSPIASGDVDVRQRQRGGCAVAGVCRPPWRIGFCFHQSIGSSEAGALCAKERKIYSCGFRRDLLCNWR